MGRNVSTGEQGGGLGLVAVFRGSKGRPEPCGQVSRRGQELGVGAALGTRSSHVGAQAPWTGAVGVGGERAVLLEKLPRKMQGEEGG